MVDLKNFERAVDRKKPYVRRLRCRHQTDYALILCKRDGDELVRRLGEYVNLYLARREDGGWNILLTDGTDRTLTHSNGTFGVHAVKLADVLPEGEDRVVCDMSWQTYGSGADCALFQTEPTWRA